MRPARIRNERVSETGFTLVELMIAIGVGAVLVYAVTTIIWNGTKATKALTSKNEFNEMIANIQSRFSNPGLCQAMFANQTSTTTPGKTSIPDLSGLGVPGTTTTPVPVSLDLGNVDAQHQGVSAVYAAGTKLGSDFTILKFEFTGKTPSNVDLTGKAVGSQYEIPLHVLASRRIGGFITATATDTATGTVTTSLQTASGSSTATGGDTLEKTFILKVTMDAKGSVINGCFGQSKGFFQQQQLVQAGVTVKTNNLQFKGADGLGAASPFPQFAVGICNLEGPFGCTPTAVPCPPTCPSAVPPFPDHAHYALDVLGQIWSDSHSDPSDARLKQNVRDIPNALARVEGLHGVEFDWKGVPDPKAGRDQLGFIAQEVERQFPEVVVTGSSGLKSVAYENLLAPMVEALKARQKLLDQQAKDLAEIRQALDDKP